MPRLVWLSWLEVVLCTRLRAQDQLWPDPLEGACRRHSHQCSSLSRYLLLSLKINFKSIKKKHCGLSVTCNGWELEVQPSIATHCSVTIPLEAPELSFKTNITLLPKITNGMQLMDAYNAGPRTH